MANEIAWEHDTSGVVLYFVVARPADAFRWNTEGTPAFEAHDEDNWADYDVAMVEQTDSGKYVGSFPAGITTAGVYQVTIYQRVGGSPAITDTKLGFGAINWNGTAEDYTGFEILTIEGSITPSAALVNDADTQLSRINGKQALAILLSALGGTLAGGGGTTVTIKPGGKSTPTRITATVDGSGNRTPTAIKVPT